LKDAAAAAADDDDDKGSKSLSRLNNTETTYRIRIFKCLQTAFQLHL